MKMPLAITALSILSSLHGTAEAHGLVLCYGALNPYISLFLFVLYLPLLVLTLGVYLDITTTKQ